jgi:transcriptional regulator with XRE-family HTH domain
MTLDQLRKDRKMTQGKLALDMNMQQSEVSRFEKRAEFKLGHCVITLAPLADTAKFAPSSQTKTLNSHSPNSAVPKDKAGHCSISQGTFDCRAFACIVWDRDPARFASSISLR